MLNDTPTPTSPRSVLVVSSPMVRAIRTIEPAAQRLGVPRERWLCYGQYHEVCVDKSSVGRVCAWSDSLNHARHFRHTHGCKFVQVGGCYLKDKVFPGRSKAEIEAAHQVTYTHLYTHPCVCTYV